MLCTIMGYYLPKCLTDSDGGTLANRRGVRLKLGAHAAFEQIMALLEEQGYTGDLRADKTARHQGRLASTSCFFCCWPQENMDC